MGSQLIAGRYELVRLLGEGGMGAVYEAQHVTTHRRCAVKLLHPHAQFDSQAKERFAREARAPAQIGHAGIVDVIDAGTDGDVPFLVMELLDGESLAARLARPLPLAERVRLVAAVLEPLGAAHARGFVHRDLKPENVFLARTGEGERVKLLDFGIARQSQTPGVTQTNVILGTALYMSPEQWRSTRDVAPAADVWSAGVMLYEAIAGRPPFSGETPGDVMIKACTEPHIPLTRAAPHAPAALCAVVDRCLRKNPAERPPDANALRAELAAIDLSRSGKRTSLALPFAAVLALGAIGGAIALAIALWPEPDPPPIEPVARVSTAPDPPPPPRRFRIFSNFDETAQTRLMLGGTRAIDVTPAAVDPSGMMTLEIHGAPGARISIGALDVQIGDSGRASVQLDAGALLLASTREGFTVDVAVRGQNGEAAIAETLRLESAEDVVRALFAPLRRGAPLASARDGSGPWVYLGPQFSSRQGEGALGDARLVAFADPEEPADAGNCGPYGYDRQAAPHRLEVLRVVAIDPRSGAVRAERTFRASRERCPESIHTRGGRVEPIIDRLRIEPVFEWMRNL